VKLADTNVADDEIGRVSWFDDFIGQFSPATKPRPQKLANFVDRLTSPEDLISKHGAVLQAWACLALVYRLG